MEDLVNATASWFRRRALDPTRLHFLDVLKVKPLTI